MCRSLPTRVRPANEVDQVLRNFGFPEDEWHWHEIDANGDYLDWLRGEVMVPLREAFPWLSRFDYKNEAEKL